MKKKEVFQIGRDLKLESKIIEKILLKITGLTKSQLFLVDEIDDKHKYHILNSFERLEKGEPLEYVINKAEFYSLDFYVDSKVLIPRNDTEVMVDKAIETIIGYNGITLIDVGTGSSCIAIAILKNTSKVNNCYVIDISENALEVSKKNIINHNLEKKIKQIHGNLLTDFLGKNDYELNKNIVITANLPYIKDNDHKNMDKETIEFEPALALYGGKETGFELYEQLIRECFQLKILNKLSNINLFIEIGFDQKEYCFNYLTAEKLKFKIFKDNGGIDRCVKIEF